MSELHDKLVEIQQCLKVPKERYNSFSDFYYRSAEDILLTVKPMLAPAILLLTDEVVDVGGWHYTKSTATLQLNGEIFQTIGWARESESKKGMDAAQISGACSSYARKYALNAMFLLSDDELDPDSNGKTGKSKAPQKSAPKKSEGSKPKDEDKKDADTGSSKPASQKQRGFIWNMCKDHSLNQEESKQLVDFATAGKGLNVKNASIIIDRMIKDWDGLIDDYLQSVNSEPSDEPEPPLPDDDDIPI